MDKTEPDGNESIDALVCAHGLKEECRAGWQRRESSTPNQSRHTTGERRFCPDRLDRERVFALCLLHDIAESVVGDSPRWDANGYRQTNEVKRKRANAKRSPAR